MGRGLAPQIDKVRPDGVMVHDRGRGETPRDVIHPPTKRQRRESSRLNQVAAGVCETPALAGLDRQTRERARKENDDGHRHNASDRGRASGWPTGHGSRAAPIPLWRTGSDRRDRRRDAMGRRTYRDRSGRRGATAQADATTHRRGRAHRVPQGGWRGRRDMGGRRASGGGGGRGRSAHPRVPALCGLQERAGRGDRGRDPEGPEDGQRWMRCASGAHPTPRTSATTGKDSAAGRATSRGRLQSGSTPRIGLPRRRDPKTAERDVNGARPGRRKRRERCSGRPTC